MPWWALLNIADIDNTKGRLALQEHRGTHGPLRGGGRGVLAQRRTASAELHVVGYFARGSRFACVVHCLVVFNPPVLDRRLEHVPSKRTGHPKVQFSNIQTRTSVPSRLQAARLLEFTSS